MRSWGIAGLGLLSLLLATGCISNSPKLSCYGDFIDDLNDRACTFDHLYAPGLDLTRIGKPDWCADRFNRTMFGTCCCESCRDNNVYYRPPTDCGRCR